MSDQHSHNSDNKQHHHHILPDSVALTIGGSLLVLTIVTVAVAHVDLGALNFPIAFAVATVKALLVALFFMNLKYDSRENGVIFGTSFLFLAIFIVLTSTDLFFRGDVYVKPGDAQAATGGAGGKSKLEKPWVSSPELVNRGKEIFAQQCTSCHGAEGKGNGPAAGALNPPPRNFTADAGWKNGRTVAGVFKTLKEGLQGSAMASYATLPVDDRWALTHFVLSLGPTPAAAADAASLAKVGVDVNQAGGGGGSAEQTIPVDVAMKRVTQPQLAKVTAIAPLNPQSVEAAQGNGAKLYASRCLSCHGAKAEGGIAVRNIGVAPKAQLVTQPLSAQISAEAFKQVVLNGVAGGDVMPSNGSLSSSELQELYQYVRGLSAGR